MERLSPFCETWRTGADFVHENRAQEAVTFARDNALKTEAVVFDDQVMDWIVDALHQSYADEKRFRRDALARLQAEQSKIQNRLDKLYDDRLDGFIEPDFFKRKAREWRQTQKRLGDQIAEYENASHDYVHEGVRLLELARKAYFLFKQQSPSEKRKLLNFVCSNSTWKDQTLTQPFATRLIFLHLQHGSAKKKGRWS